MVPWTVARTRDVWVKVCTHDLGFLDVLQSIHLRKQTALPLDRNRKAQRTSKRQGIFALAGENTNLHLADCMC